jgi:hypothetical protein
MEGCWIRPAGCFEPGGKLRGCLLPAIVASWLRHLQILSEGGHLTFPWKREGEPEDAVFNALANMTMYDRPPFDVEESTRLIKKAYQAD